MKKSIKTLMMDNENIQKQQQKLLSAISQYSLPFDSELYTNLFEYLIINKKLNPKQNYFSLNAHVFVTQKGHPGISPELDKLNSILLLFVTKAKEKPKLQLRIENFKMMTLSTEKDSLSLRINNYNPNKFHDSSLIKKRMDNKTSRSNNSKTISLKEKGNNSTVINRSRMNEIEKSKSMMVTNNKNTKIKVNFIDELYNTPLASVVLIESYKKFNLGKRYEYDGYLNSSSNSTCCTII